MTPARESPALALKSLQKRPVGFTQLSRCLQARTSNHPRQGSAGDIETLDPREMPDILPPILDMPRHHKRIRVLNRSDDAQESEQPAEAIHELGIHISAEHCQL